MLPVPIELQQQFEEKEKIAQAAAWRAIFCVPFAVLRAEPVSMQSLKVTEQMWLQIKYRDELGVAVPRLSRLREADRWMETPDDPYFPAGMYERSSLHRWLYDKGWPRLAAIAWLYRNLAYGAAAQFQYHWEPGDKFEIFGDAHPGDEHKPKEKPTKAGTWVCVVYRPDWATQRMIPVAFEVDRVWFYPRWLPWLGKRFGQMRRGWKMRPFAEGDRPVGKTASGLLQPRSIRPFQTRVE